MHNAGLRDARATIVHCHIVEGWQPCKPLKRLMLQFIFAGSIFLLLHYDILPAPVGETGLPLCSKPCDTMGHEKHHRQTQGDDDM